VGVAFALQVVEGPLPQGDFDLRVDALVTQAESRARAAGCARIEVTSALHRDGAHDFYRSQGYGRVSEHFLKRLRKPAA
jgi:hypothetical protein